MKKLKAKIEQTPSIIPMPLFMKIKEAIREKILDGTYSAHDKLPSERELTELFKVSRITVRQALADLQREGLIFKINGKGTFVTKPKASLDGSKLRGFGEAMSALGYESFSKLLSVRDIQATQQVAKNLSIPRVSLVKKIQRLRYLNRSPISLDITYFQPHIGQLVATADLERCDIFSILENECGITLGDARVNIEAVLSDEKMSGLLNVEEGTPILHIERTILDNGKKPVLYENLFYRGDAFKYSIAIERENQPLSKIDSSGEIT